MKDNKKNEYYQKIGGRIKRARIHLGLTQSELGERLSTPLTATAISLYEKGEREVSLKVLEEIAKILDVSLQFLTLDEEASKTPSINVVLRADKKLSRKAQDQIIEYIEYVKSRSKKNGDKGTR